MNCHKAFGLPNDIFTAGNTRTFKVNTFSAPSLPLDLTGANVYFSLSNYVHRGEPVLSKQAELVAGENGIYSARATLAPSDTLNLAGKYIYQFTVVDRQNNAYSERGVVVICPNTNKAVLTNL